MFNIVPSLSDLGLLLPYTVPEGLPGVRHVPAVLVSFLAPLCSLSLPGLTAVKSRLWLHLGFVASSLQWDWKAVSQNFGVWHQMKVNAFNVDLEALVWMNCKGFVTFWLPWGFFWYLLFVSAWFWIDEISWFLCRLRLLLQQDFLTKGLCSVSKWARVEMSYNLAKLTQFPSKKEQEPTAGFWTPGWPLTCFASFLK